jgi:hypothetical protein
MPQMILIKNPRVIVHAPMMSTSVHRRGFTLFHHPTEQKKRISRRDKDGVSESFSIANCAVYLTDRVEIEPETHGRRGNRRRSRKRPSRRRRPKAWASIRDYQNRRTRMRISFAIIAGEEEIVAYTPFPLAILSGYENQRLFAM